MRLHYLWLKKARSWYLGDIREILCSAIIEAALCRALLFPIAVDDKERCLDLPRIAEAAASFALAHTELPHCLGMALSVLRNSSCLADEASAQQMDAHRALQWACYAVKVLPEDAKVADEAMHLCGNLFRFPSLQGPPALATLPELSEMCTTVLMYHSSQQAIVDGVETMVHRILQVRPENATGREDIGIPNDGDDAAMRHGET